MCKYIVEFGYEPTPTNTPDMPIGEEIVLCRDCKHYHKHKWFDIIPGTPLGSDISDVCMFFSSGVKVEPDGFCAWGERREE